jgi:hypothetical protein
MPGKRLITGLAAAVASALVLCPAAGAVSPATAVSNLNQQRTENKLPAGIAEGSGLSSGCQMHDNYMRLNGNTLTHDEAMGRPGFTPAGQAAGASSVLAQGAPAWNTARENPWETAPIHLTQVLDPALLVTGYDESFGFSCLVTLDPTRRPAPAFPQLFTYPGPGARIYSKEVASEAPFAPGELIGIPAGKTTGPYLYVFAFGGSETSRIASAVLRKKQGKRFRRKVKVKVVDGTNPQLGPFIPPGGMVIPVKGLSKGKYRAAVVVDSNGQTLSKTWTFRAT